MRQRANAPQNMPEPPEPVAAPPHAQPPQEVHAWTALFRHACGFLPTSASAAWRDHPILGVWWQQWAGAVAECTPSLGGTLRRLVTGGYTEAQLQTRAARNLWLTRVSQPRELEPPMSFEQLVWAALGDDGLVDMAVATAVAADVLPSA